VEEERRGSGLALPSVNLAAFAKQAMDVASEPGPKAALHLSEPNKSLASENPNVD